ncbi:hypothetical protein Tcan_16145 [Toxocara canis]|uniref:G_PROTEIN_RECEP_F1_2 domain-containing protein n=1 Tax=Toxocara canis TaxID=6265 RepID=A0A0B2VN93_TOXCA|nr:hypothetical protein Tcan_16145 [Toxocara canis]
MKYELKDTVRFFHINAYISTLLTIICTSVLLYAIITRTPTEMQRYRIFLLNHSIASLILSILFVLCQPIPDSTFSQTGRPPEDSGISCVVLGPVVRYFPPFVNHFLTSAFVGVLLYIIISIPLSFVFRYFAVCRRQQITTLVSKKVCFHLFP